MSTAPPPPLPPLQPAPPPSKSGIPLALIIIGGVLLVIFIIAALAGLAAPLIIKMRKKGDQVMAVSHGRNLTLSLNGFSTEYGSFPDRETAKQVIALTDTSLDLTGDTANDYFRQIIAAGIVKSEDPFFAISAYSRHTPDNNFVGTHALQAGEVGFGYIMNGDKAMPGNDPEAVIAATPLLMGGRNGEFDPKPMAGRAVLIRLDSSVKLARIRPDHQVDLGNGKTLLDTGPDTVWGNAVAPVIKPPKAR